VLTHFKRAIEERRRQIATQLLEGGADSYEKYMWHVGYSAGMLEAINLLQEIVDASDSEE
jgi:hypothetical protein